MTALKNISLQKADAVEIERRYSGQALRRAAYCLYITIVIVCTVLLYLYPSLPMISLFIFINLGLLLSLYYFVSLVVNSEKSDLVYDGTRLAWRPSFSTQGSEMQRRQSYFRNEHLSYSFI